MRRASRGRLEVPLSCSDVDGNDALMGAGAVPFVCAGCEVCVLGCVEEAVGGLGLGAPVAVVGGVESMFSPPGEAIVGYVRQALVKVSDCGEGAKEAARSKSDLRGLASTRES